MPERGPDGKFRRADDDTFVEITNADIYREVKGLGARVERVENRVGGLEARIAAFHRRCAMAVPTATVLASAATVWYYLRGGH